jgi:high-affinity Fe2+/Pb2+ permease
MIDAFCRALFVSAIGAALHTAVFGWEPNRSGGVIIGLFLGTFIFWGIVAHREKKKKA